MAEFDFKVEQANTYVRIFDYNPHVKNAIHSYCHRNLTRWKKVPTDYVGGTKWEISQKFYYYGENEKEIRIVRGFYEGLLKYLRQLHIYPKTNIPVTLPEINPHKSTFNWKDIEFKPRNQDQEDYLDFILDDKNKLTVINGTTGFGKALRNDTNVLTPSGWRPISSLRMGDKVITPSGKIASVTGVYPQGKIAYNKVTFKDGRTALCCHNHLWKIFDKGRIRPHYQVMSTSEIIDRISTSNRYHLYIPLAAPQELPSSKLPIDPYLIGALLGDSGYYVNGQYIFHNTNKYVIDVINNRLEKYGITLLHCRGNDYILSDVSTTGTHNISYLKYLLEELGLVALPTNKQIPPIYLRSAIKDRMQLLQGLMDSNGTALGRKKPSYFTTSLKLAKDVQKLVWSLGGIAEISGPTKRWVYDGSIKTHLDAHVVNIKIKDIQNVFTDPIKKACMGKAYLGRHLKLGIKSIEPAGVDYCTCIAIDSEEKLFVIDDYIVTHNTIVSIMAFVKIGERVVITNSRRHVSIWLDKFSATLDLKPEDVMMISDFNLVDAYEKLVNGEINPKVVFFNLSRIDVYIKRMKENPGSLPPLDEFFNAIGAGIRLIDEAHEEILSIYNSLLFGNMKRNVALSATLSGDNEFVNKIYNATFPPYAFLKPPTYKKYIHMVNYVHRMNVDKYGIRTKGFGGYSHVLYENGILRRRQVFERYYQMMKEAFVSQYLENKKEGQKALWFFATVAMCEAFYARLKKDYPDMDIVVFTGKVSKQKGKEMEYANHDVVISTPKSCGTGKDIEKLFIVFAGYVVSSSQLVIQMTGRLREVDKWWPGMSPIYVVFVCRDVVRQVEYAKKMRTVMHSRVKEFSVCYSNVWV